MAFGHRFALIAALAAVLFVVLPATASSQVDGTDVGIVLAHVDSARGPLDVAASVEGWCFVRLAGTWVGPISISSLDRLGQANATAGTSGCAVKVVGGIGAPPTLLTTTFAFSATSSSIASAVAQVASQLAGLQNSGWVVSPCGGSGSTTP